MGLWNKKPAVPPRWDCAREITKTEAESGVLPPGWYIYPDGYMWYGLRPGDNGMEHSCACHDPKELIPWLGVPVPEPRSAAKPSSSLDDLVRQTIQPKPPLPDMHRIQETEHSPAPLPQQETDASRDPPSGKNTQTPPEIRSGSQGRTRNNELHFWFSDAELKRFRVRVQRAGLNQSEFLRRAALTGRIVVDDRDPVNTAIIDELEQIRAELGRQGGMLKMVVKPNQGQRELHPEEWEDLIRAIRYLEHTKDRLGALEERFNGNRQT